MAGPNILESYLVSLSMKGPSSAEQREAEKAFSTLAEAVAAIVPTITAAATAIVYATDKIAGGLSKLYFESQKTGATVREITALGYAFEQNGSTLEKFHADFDKFSQTLHNFPNYRTLLRDNLGLKPGDFKDDLTTYSATLKALAIKRAAGDTQAEGAFRNLFGFDEDNIIARGRVEFDKFYAEGFERNKGIDEQSVKAVALVRSLNAFGAALEEVGRKAAAALFDKYGIVLDDMTKWVDDHSGEIIAVVTEVVDQFVLAWKDIEPIAVPAIQKISFGLDSTAAALDRILGSPDGQHGGLHAVRYVLDALAIYIAGKWALRLLGLLGLRGLTLGLFGLGGAPATAAAVLGAAVMPQPLNEGEDEPYRQAHPGWTPDKPKDPNWDRTASAPPLQPEGKTGYHGEPGLGMPGQAHGETMVETTDSHGHSYVINKKHAEQFNSFLNDLQEHGYKVKTVGGFEDRANANDPGKLSKHARGKAIDINADQNPNQRNLQTDMPPGISELAHKHGLKWGGDFKGTKDPMHFEIENEHQSMLEGAHAMLASFRDAHSKIAALMSSPHLHENVAMLVANRSQRPAWMVGSSKLTSDLGSNKNVQIHVTTTDPHMAASEIARHMREIHAENFKNLHRPYGHGSSVDRVKGRLNGAGWLNRGIEHNDIRPPSGSSNDEIKSQRYEKYGRSSV